MGWRVGGGECPVYAALPTGSAHRLWGQPRATLEPLRLRDHADFCTRACTHKLRLVSNGWQISAMPRKRTLDRGRGMSAKCQSLPLRYRATRSPVEAVS